MGPIFLIFPKIGGVALGRYRVSELKKDFKIVVSRQNTFHYLPFFPSRNTPLPPFPFFTMTLLFLVFLAIFYQQAQPLKITPLFCAMCTKKALKNQKIFYILSIVFWGVLCYNHY